MLLFGSKRFAGLRCSAGAVLNASDRSCQRLPHLAGNMPHERDAMRSTVERGRKHIRQHAGGQSPEDFCTALAAPKCRSAQFLWREYIRLFQFLGWYRVRKE